MIRPGIDLEKLRGALRRLSQTDLLVLAERATELVPPAIRQLPTRIAVQVDDRLVLLDP